MMMTYIDVNDDNGNRSIDQLIEWKMDSPFFLNQLALYRQISSNSSPVIKNSDNRFRFNQYH